MTQPKKNGCFILKRISDKKVEVDTLSFYWIDN